MGTTTLHFILAINVAIDLAASRNVKEALKNLASILGNDLLLNPSFFDSLSVLDNMVLGGSVLVDVTFSAMIDQTAVQAGDYATGVDVSLLVNQFEANAYLEANDLDLEFRESFLNIIGMISNHFRAPGF